MVIDKKVEKVGKWERRKEDRERVPTCL